MTIAEAIIKRLGTEGAAETIPLTVLARGMAFCLYADACRLNGIDPDTKILSTLSNETCTPALRQGLHWAIFLDWWLKQDVADFTEEDGFENWYDVKQIAECLDRWTFIQAKEWGLDVDMDEDGQGDGEDEE